MVLLEHLQETDHKQIFSLQISTLTQKKVVFDIALAFNLVLTGLLNRFYLNDDSAGVETSPFLLAKHHPFLQ